MLHRRRPIDDLQVCSYLLAVLPGKVVQGIAHQMNDAQLDSCLGKDGLDGLGEPRQAIDTGDEYLLHTSVLEVGQDREPELRALLHGRLHAQKFLVTLQVDAQDEMDR